MKHLLHIGCGPKHKDRTTHGFNNDTWHEIRLDIDPMVLPDVTGTMTDMATVASASVQGIFPATTSNIFIRTRCLWPWRNFRACFPMTVLQ
jgi:hypothetical protein